MKIKTLLFLILSFTAIHQPKHLNIPPTLNGIYKFTGKLNGKIPVFMWFAVKDSVLKGEVTYLKTAKRLPITIIGQITKADRATIWGTMTKNNIITIYEFAKSGNVTGTYEGEFSTTVLTGFWGGPGSDKQLKFALSPKDTAFTPTNTDLKPLAINGSYYYQFGKNGSTGSVDIKQTGPGNYLINIGCVTPAPARNIADVETFKSQLINNAFVFKIPDSDCQFRLRPFNGFVVIDKFSGNTVCGFGLNASIDGIFIKTGEKAKID